MLAREFIPAEYRGLHMLRLFLPARGTNDRAQRWSDLLYVGDELSGSSDWNELYSRFAQDHPGKDWPQAAMGLLDPPRAAAFEELLIPRLGADATFRTRTWSGHAPQHPGSETSVFDGREYQHESLDLRQVLARARTKRIPDFGHDLAGRFAWGSNIYPDSLIIAAEPEIFRAFFNEPRLEVVSIVEHRDILPASSGD